VRRRVRWLALVLAGCSAPLTVAEPRDAGPPFEPTSPPAFGEASVADAADEPPPLGDPVDPPPDASDADASDADASDAADAKDASSD